MTSMRTAGSTAFTGWQLRSTLSAEGVLTVELVEHEWAAPTGTQILVRVEAAPINPSDLGLLFGPADTETAQYWPGRVVARMPQGAVQALRARHGISLPAGNEGAGTVVAAGEDPSAQALLGRRVAAVPGTAFGTYAHAEAGMSLPLADDVSAEQGASSFVNPMTALGFLETMRAQGFTGLVHAAAASNLGQMLVRICREDGVPLVNIVRSQAQVELLEGLGARYVLDSTDPGFTARLAEAIGQTGAMLGFDPIGGGTMAGRILTAMEAAASRGAAYSRYGSSTPKRVYIYGGLDAGPTILHRSFGLTWDLGGWLLFPFITQAGPAVVAGMRERVMRDLTTTFASHYSNRVSLQGMLTNEAVSRYTARRTGEKYLVLPNG